jgi:hypothetical protein
MTPPPVRTVTHPPHVLAFDHTPDFLKVKHDGDWYGGRCDETWQDFEARHTELYGAPPARPYYWCRRVYYAKRPK